MFRQLLTTLCILTSLNTHAADGGNPYLTANDLRDVRKTYERQKRQCSACIGCCACVTASTILTLHLTLEKPSARLADKLALIVGAGPILYGLEGLRNLRAMISDTTQAITRQENLAAALLDDDSDEEKEHAD